MFKISFFNLQKYLLIKLIEFDNLHVFFEILFAISSWEYLLIKAFEDACNAGRFGPAPLLIRVVFLPAPNRHYFHFRGRSQMVIREMQFRWCVCLWSIPHQSSVWFQYGGYVLMQEYIWKLNYLESSLFWESIIL